MSQPLPTLWLVRHGETAWSLAGRHTGSTDMPLTDEGEAMANGLAPLLANAGFAQVLSSPRQRALRTCELATGRGDITVDPDLAEWSYGEFEGLHSREIALHHPGWSVFRDGCPGGETVADIERRADRLLARLRRLSGPTALFTHGQFACVLAMRWIGFAVGDALHLTLDPAAISILGPELGHEDVPAIIRWNVVSEARL